MLKQCFSFVKKPSHNQRIAEWKKVNFCKLIPETKNVTDKLFFSSVILRPQLTLDTRNVRYHEILGLEDVLNKHRFGILRAFFHYFIQIISITMNPNSCPTQ